MTISLNGENHEVPEALDITMLLKVLALPPQTVLVEHNGVALHRSEWSTKTLADGDVIEILKVSAGG